MLIGMVEWRGGDQRGGFSIVVVGMIDRFFVCVCVLFSLLLLVIMWWLFLVFEGFFVFFFPSVLALSCDCGWWVVWWSELWVCLDW